MEGDKKKASDDSFKQTTSNFLLYFTIGSPIKFSMCSHQVPTLFPPCSQRVPIPFLPALQFLLYFTICSPPPPSSPCVHIKFPTCSQCVPMTFACTGILIVCLYLFLIKFSVCSHQVPHMFPPCSHNLCLHWNSYCVSLFVPHEVLSVFTSSSHCVPTMFP